MMVEEGRMIKSPREIEYITQAARATEAGVLAGIEASAVGATENEVAAAVHTAQIKAGSEYTGPSPLRDCGQEVLPRST